MVFKGVIKNAFLFVKHPYIIITYKELKMKKYLIILMIIITTSINCFAKNQKEDNKLIVAMELQYPPFEMSDENGNPAGISVEIAKDLAKYLGREVVIENIAWTGLIPSLQTNKADIIISSMTITDERSKVVDFSNPYIKSGLSLLIYKNSNVQGYKDIDKEGVIVAVKSGTTGANLAKEKI